MISNYFAQIPEIDYSDFRLLIEDVTSRCPRNTAFRMRAQDESFQEMNYAEAYRQIRTVAAYLLHSGIGKGDRVGLISENRMEWTITYLAAVYA
ncbi:MAG: AMP-binding protein, partial [Sediminispirochaetaceae bacterium]